MKKKFRIVLMLLTVVLLMSVFVTPFAAGWENATSAQIKVSQAAPSADVSAADFLSFADEFIERRTAALTGTMKMMPELVVGNGTLYESMRVVDAEKNALAELNARRDVLREWGEAYSHSFTEVMLQRYNIEDGVVTLDVEEFTKLYYEKIRGDEPDYTAWVTHRRFVFSKGTTGWELVSQELLNSNGPAPKNEPAGATQDAMR
jgi:deoxycytidylate deaminase